MFAKWVSVGAIIGIKAFFAIAVFGLLCLGLFGFLGLLASIARWAGDGKDDVHRD